MKIHFFPVEKEKFAVERANKEALRDGPPFGQASVLAPLVEKTFLFYLPGYKRNAPSGGGLPIRAYICFKKKRK